MFSPETLGILAVGTAALGGLYAPVSDDIAMATLITAAERGITHFDTAPHYGRGLAERRLGDFLRRVDPRQELTVSTKVGRTTRELDTRPGDDIFLGAPPGESIFDFTASGIRQQLTESRDRLGRDFIDVVLLHDPDDHLDEALVAAEELFEQRVSGRIGAVGVGTNSAAVAEHLLDRIRLDVVLLAGRITLLEDSGEAVAARCNDDHVALLAAGVFQSGILAGGDTYDYFPAPVEIRTKVDELTKVCESHGSTLQEAAINHPGRVTGVTTTVVGVRSPAEVDQAVDAINTDLPSRLWVEIDRIRSHGTQERAHNPGTTGDDGR